jgi:hypothetical protein|tara:strand:+ start:190 stop:387 length:198 start_codon:yes stop_codon:yes gene_type:complete
MEGSLFMFAVLIDIILAFYAGYLSYSCSRQTGELSRFMFAILAFILGPIYLIYYFFANYLTGNCR